MHLAMIGLGKMGFNMSLRLLRAGHQIVAYDTNSDAVSSIVKEGAIGASTLPDMVGKLESPRAVWIMVPSQSVDSVLVELTKCASATDIIIDGGNSFYKDSIRRSELLKTHQLNFLDAGTSGGVWGLDNGYCLMLGGEKESVSHLSPIFDSLAPPDGWLHCGRAGAGHFVKMIHNGIEYGIMQAYAEGFDILRHSDFDLDLAGIAQLWQHGSVVRSWLLELAASALAADPNLEKLEPFVQDSGEGRWTIDSAVELGVPATVLAHSLFARFASRDTDSFALKMLAALRNQFGGHAVKEKTKVA